jgi:hypothetical protein
MSIVRRTEGIRRRHALARYPAVVQGRLSAVLLGVR